MGEAVAHREAVALGGGRSGTPESVPECSGERGEPSPRALGAVAHRRYPFRHQGMRSAYLTA